MKRKNRFMNQASLLALIILVVFLISLIPIFYASLFSHPVADDYSFSYRVHNSLINGSSIFDAVTETVAHTYNTWQGTFSAVAIFSIQPGVFSSSLYCLTTFIMIGFLSASTFFFYETVIVRFLRGKLSYAVIISLISVEMCIQYVPDIFEAFYWFNGSAFYTLFYSFALIFLTLILRLKLADSPVHKTALFLPCLVLGFIIGGGNYTTALVVAEIVVLITLAEFYKKSGNKWSFFFILLTYLISFAINVVAPGNHIRAEKVIGMNPVMAILQSLFHALGLICEWTTVPQMLYIAIVIMLSVLLVPNCSASFKNPLLALFLAFLLFASQMTPPLFAMSNIGSGRQINIYYYSYYLLITFSFFYLTGWIYQRISDLNGTAPSSKISGLGEIIQKKVWIIALIFCIILCANSYHFGILKMTTFQATKAILSGSLVEYDEQYESLVDNLKSGEGLVEVRDVETVPPFFSNLQLSEDPDFWTNKAIARYFGIEGIKKQTD